MFENLPGIDEIEGARIERNIHSVEGTELRIISPARPYFRRLFNIKSNPLDRWIDRPKVVHALARSTTEVDDRLDLLLFIEQLFKIIFGRDLPTVVIRQAAP
jgi:hypothetical protein